MGRLIETRHESPLHWETHDINSEVLIKNVICYKSFAKTEFS